MNINTPLDIQDSEVVFLQRPNVFPNVQDKLGEGVPPPPTAGSALVQTGTLSALVKTGTLSALIQTGSG